MAKYPCRICSKSVAETHKAVYCDICHHWIHIKCNSITNSEYDKLKDSNSPWYCIKCVNETTPFSSMSNEELFLNSNGQILSQDSTFRFSLPSYQSERIESFRNFLSIHNESETPQLFNLPENSYYEIDKLNTTSVSKSNLGVLHMNISSIANHINDLKKFLDLSQHKFDIICITESRIQKFSNPSVKIDLPGYTFFFFIRNHFIRNFLGKRPRTYKI